MSVLACSRRGCDNIMCDRYNARYGYICERCFQEAKEKRPDNPREAHRHRRYIIFTLTSI